MKFSPAKSLAVALGLAVGLAALCAGRAESQDPSLAPTYGTVTLKAGFEPDPFTKKLNAGGPIQTELGGVKAWVAKAPDFRLNYTAGQYALTIHVEAEGDTTLLVNLPDGKWVADDDSGGNLNPLLRFEKPQSGQYDIWVGTYNKASIPAVLKITELK